MNKNLFKLLGEATQRELDPMLQEYAHENGLTIVDEGAETDLEEGKITREDLVERLKTTEEFIQAQFTGKDKDGKSLRDLPSVKIREALGTSDVSIVFPRVISNILEMPVEPELFLTNALTEWVRLPDNAPLLIEFPTIDAIQAFDMAEGQEYQVQTANYQQHVTSIRLKKVGVAAAINQELIDTAMWPLVSMHLKMMGEAINRKIESNLYKTMQNAAQIVLDNENSDSNYHTTGKKFSAGTETANATLSYDDIITMCGILLGNRKNATHLLAHPLAWPILATDPIMRAQFYHGGQLGSGIWNRAPQFNQQAAMPFGISYVPYYAIPFVENDTLTLSPTFSGEAACLTTELYLVDQSQALFGLTRGETQMDEMEDWFKDARMMKAKKYVGLSAKDRGRGMLRAKSIRVAKNEQKLFNVGTVDS